MKKRYEGRSLDEALQNACFDLGLDLEDLDYTLIQNSNNMINTDMSLFIIEASPKENQKTQEHFDNEIDYIVNLIKTFLYKLSIRGYVIFEYQKNKNLYFNIKLKNERDLMVFLGKSNKNIESFQALVNAIFQKKMSSRLKIFIDCNDYKKRKDMDLIHLASEMSQEVIKTGNPVKTHPMGKFNRIIFYSVVNTYENISAKSEGEGDFKPIVISKENNS